MTIPYSGIFPEVRSIEPEVTVQLMLSSAILNRGLIVIDITDVKRDKTALALLTVEAAQVMASQLQALIEAVPVRQTPESQLIAELIADDASTWPYGHPCRDCDQLAKDHAPEPNDQCEGWR